MENDDRVSVVQSLWRGFNNNPSVKMDDVSIQASFKKLCMSTECHLLDRALPLKDGGIIDVEVDGFIDREDVLHHSEAGPRWSNANLADFFKDELSTETFLRLMPQKSTLDSTGQQDEPEPDALSCEQASVSPTPLDGIMSRVCEQLNKNSAWYKQAPEGKIKVIQTAWKTLNLADKEELLRGAIPKTLSFEPLSNALDMQRYLGFFKTKVSHSKQLFLDEIAKL